MRKFIAVALVAVIISATLLVPVFGAVVTSTDSKIYWTSGSWLWYYSSDQYSDTFTLTTFTSTVNWSNAFPDQPLVINGYVNNFTSVGLLLSDATITSASPAYNVNIQYKRPLIFLKDVTYCFFLRFDSIDVRNSSSSSDIPFTLGDISCSLRDSSSSSLAVLGRTRSSISGMSDCFMFTFTPSSDISASSFRFTITNSSYSPSMPYSINECDISLSLSNFCSYTGDPDSVVINPQLDSIEKQVDDINDAINNNPFGVITGSHPDDPYDDLNEQDRIHSADDLFSRMELFITGIPSNVATFWKDVVETLFAFPIFLPFITLGVGFILMRMLLGR